MRQERTGDGVSKPRYDWWSYVKAIIRRYPALRVELQEMQRPTMASDYSGMPRGSGAARNTERIAIRELPTQRQREYEAVRRAVEATERMPNGRDRIRVIDFVFWRHSHTLERAALVIPCSYRTARRYHAEFIRQVGRNMGFLDGE